MSRRADYLIQRLVRYPAKICAVDGEGITLPNGEHRYVMLVARDGRGGTAVLAPGEGQTHLSTAACVDFLLSLPRDRTLIWFGGGYDTTMILRDFPQDQLAAIVNDGWGYHRRYRARYLRQRQLQLGDKTRKVTLTDVLPYFQSSFIKALDEWQVGTAEERETIRRLKALRNEFVSQDREEVLRYCILECDLLIQLCLKLWGYLDDAGIYPTRLYGVGPIASFLLERHKVDRYAARDPLVTPQADASFFGGRFDLAAIGRIGHCYDYDINSAYPHALLLQPCLQHGSWRRASQYDPSAPVALWRVRWEVPRTARWGPLPWRDKQGGVWYPAQGRGWYWDAEVAAAIRCIEHYGGRWHIDRGYVFDVGCEHQPFAWVQDVFDQRAAWKRAGNPAEKVLKLGPNACYGKLAQTVGYTRNDDGTVQPPRWRNAIWAGRVTARTRATLLDATFLAPDAVLSHATDGVVSTAPLPLPLGDALGEWKVKEVDTAWFIQPGVYYLGDPKTAKTRGHVHRELDWSALTAAWGTLEWLTDPTAGWEYETTRFVGLGAAVRGGVYAQLRGRWVCVPRRVLFYPARRTVGDSPSAIRRAGRSSLLLPFWQGVTDSASYIGPATAEERDAALGEDQLWQEDQP